MLADSIAERTEDLFPTLSSTQVADQRNAERVLRSARAEIALLALELRVLCRDVAMAEAEADRRPEDPELPPGAGELLATALEQRVAARRSELVADAEQARAEAARLVTAAQDEAAAVVAAARDEMLAVLLDGSDPRFLNPPALRVVRDALPALTSSAAPDASAPQPAPSSPAARQTLPPPPSLADPPTIGCTADDVATTAPPRMSFWARYLYVDVLLPLVAVLIVVVVLLAWVG